MKKQIKKSNRRCPYCNLPAKDDKTFLCDYHYKSSRGGKIKLKK